jgi:hypothetical protein
LLQLSTLGLALGHFGYLSKYGLPDRAQGIDRLTTVLMCTHNFVAALYYALLARRFQVRRAWQLLLTLPLWVWPIQLGLLACDQTTPALQLNFVSALCGSVLGLVSVFSSASDLSLRRSIRGLYLLQAGYLLFSCCPVGPGAGERMASVPGAARQSGHGADPVRGAGPPRCLA